jgi:pimeloyl-ACP methyl ester carboxylesterase
MIEPSAADLQSLEALAASHPAQTLRVGEVDVSYRAAGQGAALVLLHGIGSGSASWLHQIDALSARYRVIAWDAPGYGGSTPLPMAAPFAADYAARLLAFVDTFGLQRFVLVGHSLGALIAGAFAARHPQRLRGLLLGSPAGGHARLAPEQRQAKLDARIGPMQQLGPAGLARERAANLLSDGASPAALALVRWNMARLDPQGYAQAARMLAQGDLAGDLSNHVAGRGLPVQVIWGDQDRVTTPAACAAIAAACPDAGTQVLPGLGHAIYIEAPDTVSGAIAAFASGVPA